MFINHAPYTLYLRNKNNVILLIYASDEVSIKVDI